VDSVKELFTPPQQQNQGPGGGRGQFFQNFFGGGGGPGGGGPFGGGGGPGGGRGGFGGGNTARGNTSATAARVVAVADERSNSLIVAAVPDAMPEIERLVKEIDVPVDEVTEIRLFPLQNSDPYELVDLLTQLFPDPTTSNNQNQNRFGGFRGGFGGGGFGGGGFGGGRFGGGNRGQQNTTSERAVKQSRVMAVADGRTSSVIVTASRDLMPQIEQMVRQLDSSKAKKQHVYVYNIENADVTQIEQIVRQMFDTSNNSQNNNTTSALASRQTQAIQNQNTGGNTIGQGFGGGGGGGLGNQFGR
jgi:type II secretory pathway component GspD/PulD (secretin)